ncbi:propionyl-CoA carboxylase alpha chain [Lewinella marina]|uniref:acetyl-CoA carboxylase biotin carboxylase subunit n=1 Tax=Neolewinella marina TaxID=438751 RepID=UPI0014315509|nr:biotin carboxylase N-terminal domain-containing protein [Neolewinella marina]NJB85433.1 propionyl-CoA carboxylase alpha chain [Neolewinella marina]
MKKILVANRGEIALRVMRTARRMGLGTVAVYSDADRTSPHVRFADEAVHLGPAPSAQSYLDMDKVIAAAGITFIGPRPHAIEVMGNKLAAKETVSAYDIPMVPGLDEAVDDPDRARAVAREIGFPILIKAAAGGGGKGMRVVDSAEELEEQMHRAISEARNAFGDGSVFIEKYIASPHHIEIQVLADTHGNCVHLFERDCSIQRRHQKVVEEAPSAVLDPALRREMGAAAVRVAQSCDYVGAGTVEFLLDADRNFYFLEMNTRLQVEHPVTEFITGIDLVEQQIRVAEGEVLSFRQEDLTINGHALELRVYAEDPANGFLPSIGRLTTYRTPPDARVDDGFEEGMDIPIHYDPMIAKLVTHGATRGEAIAKMLTAIAEYHIEGIETTLPFGRFVFTHEAFRSGDFDTHFVAHHFRPEAIAEAGAEETRAAALFAAFLYQQNSQRLTVPRSSSIEWLSRH